MNLDPAHKAKVSAWIAEGLKLSDIQKRLSDELGHHLTYMEVRFLVDDLKLTPKDIEPPKTAEIGQPAAQAAPQYPPGAKPSAPSPGPQPPSASRGVSVAVDEIARPGMVVSGKVTFADGQRAEWHLDQMGRLGLMPQQAGYRPTEADVAMFQAALQDELAKLGF